MTITRLRFALFLLLVCWLAACKVNHLAQIQPQGYRMEPQSTALPPADEAIEALIMPYKTQLDAEMNEVIGTAAHTLATGKPEGTLGNWMSDLFQEQISAYMGKTIDFAMMNSGGIRIPTLQQGQITRGKIYELMPFDNMLVVVYVDASVVQEFADKMAREGGSPVSRQLRFVINNGKALNVTVNGQPLQPGRVYSIGTSDYIANGGSDHTFFVDKPRDEVGVLMRDAIIEYVKKQTAQGRQIQAEKDGRVQ